MVVNRLYWILLLNLALIFDSVDAANGEATDIARGQQAPLAKKYRALMGNTEALHFQKHSATTIKTVVNDFAFQLRSRLHDQEGSFRDIRRSGASAGADDEWEEPYPRRRLTMILTSLSPSAIAQRGVILSASIHQLQVGYKTLGELLREGGRKVKRGVVVTIQRIMRFVRSSVRFTRRQYKRAAACTLISTMNLLQHLYNKLQTLAVNEKLIVEAPTPVSSPVMSRLSLQSSASTTSSSVASSSPTWLSSSRSNVPVVVSKTAPTKSKAPNKKSPAVSMEQLTGASNNDFPVVVPQPSLLGGLFSKLMGGLLILSSGAIVGYFWTDWSDERRQAAMRNREFLDSTTMDTSGAPAAFPITPEAPRY